MTTVKSLHEDVLYTILSKCSSSIDMWHFLLALDYELSTMTNLRAFWGHIRLSSLHNKTIIFSFIREISICCVDLRIDNLNWMITADLRRLLSYFRLLVCFHTGNVSLSKSTLINDIKTLFPFLKYVTLLISLDDSTVSHSITRQSATTDDMFEEICTSLNQINHLEHISLVLQYKKGGCLSDSRARVYFRLVCNYISNLASDRKLISIEENGYEIGKRFLATDIAEEPSFGPINISLLSTIKHLIVSFRPMLNVNLTLEMRDDVRNKLSLETLVLPCVLSTLNSIDMLDLDQLEILDIGYVNVKDRQELTRLDELLQCHRRHSLRNLTISLSEWQSARLVVVWKKEDNRQATTSNTQFSSVFENCFDQVTTPEKEMEKPTFFDQPSTLDKTSDNPIAEFILEFLDDSSSSLFQLSLQYSWLTKLTNLNLTGVHCHSIDFQYLFHSLHSLRSLSLSPCLLLYIDQFQCHCQTISTSYPYQIHSLNKQLLSLNLISPISNMKQSCSIFLEQYKLHCIRHSSIHQYLQTHQTLFEYEHIIRYAIRTILLTLDLHHFSIRIPHYELHLDDLNIQHSNHLQSFIMDVKLPMTFHSKLARLYSTNVFHCLRRLILISDNNFQLTPLLIDRFCTLEIVEILAVNCHLNRSTIHYLETVLKPNKYPNLNTFRCWINSVDANHLLKHLHKTVRLAFEKCKPAFQFDISIVNSSSRLFQTRQCILYDHTHELHKLFHTSVSIHSNQLSVMYPNFLNYKPLYSEQKFDK